MVMTRTFRPTGVGVSACGALLLAGCGSSGKSNNATSGGPVSTSAAGGTGASGGVLGPAKAATGSPVKIGFITDGKSATIDNSSEIPAAQAAAKYVNEHLGGVAGHAITLDV